MRQDTTTIVCDKCGRTIIRDDVYGYGHACPVHLKEINQQIDEMYNPYVATPEELRIRRDLRDYANTVQGMKIFIESVNVI